MNIFKCYKCSEIWVDEDDSYTNDDCGSCGARHVEAIQTEPVEVVYHGEGGHGYYEVRLELLDKVGVTQKISRFSYLNKSRAFLEEDADFSQFVRSLAESLGLTVKELHLSEVLSIKDNDRDNTWIRSLGKF